MYHCRIRFYFTGRPCRVFELIKEAAPMEHFMHEFWESGEIQTDLAEKADVIFANLTDAQQPSVLQTLLSCKPKETELILLVQKKQAESIADQLSELKDFWIMPMSDAEIVFRFIRWQQSYKREKDFWQTSQYLEATINYVPNLIWYKDKNGIHEKVNDCFCRTVKKTKQQVEGRGHAYIWNVEHDDPACIESEREVMRKKRTFVSEEMIETGNGKKILTTYKSPLYDLDGSVMGTVGVAIDVTQERAYEQEIIKKNQTLEMILTSLDCGVIRHATDGTKIFSINKAALKLLGYDSKEALAKDFHFIAGTVVEEDRVKLRENILRLQKEGDSVSVEYRVRHKDGELLHLMGSIKYLVENGVPLYQRFLLDCTEQKLQENKDKRRQMQLVQALGVDFNLVCFFDLDTGTGSLIRSDENNSQKLISIFSGDISLQDSMGYYIQEFVHADDRELVRQASMPSRLKQELLHKNVYSVNYRSLKNGEIKYFQMKAVRAGEWDTDQGIVLGFRSVDEEIRKEMEKKRLLEDALFQANRANRAKSTFLSNMSHDIRTPMNAIVGFTNLAITHIDHKEQVEEYLSKIQTSGNHLLSLINDVLDMSRIESGKIQLDEKLCSLPEILHGLRSILQADIRAKQMELCIDAVDVLDEEIFCDKLRLNQVLLNLLSNCVKYTPAGGTVSIRITEKPGDKEGYANYEFYIKDTGIGMSEDFVSHIFEPFEREESATNSGIQGTGLGMAITKNIVDMMDGTIEVRSEQGKGSEFIVTFTFRLSGKTEESQDIPELKNCRALVVDDDFDSCDSVTYMLQQIGLRAEWTLSGKEAVLRTHQAVMREDSYSVYIIDWMLPDMNGIEVTRRIRKEMGEDVSVIVLTAYDWADIEDEAKEAGVSALCSKPLFLSELRRCLHKIVNTDEDKEKNGQKQNGKRHTGRILLAEDIDLNQEIAVAILEEAGFQTEVADNGKIAVEMLKKSKPGYYQIVLMDVQMPVMNGYETTREIRRLENRELASVPIIAMTANAFEEDKQEALRCGMNGHIAKPIDVKKLFETLDHILD